MKHTIYQVCFSNWSTGHPLLPDFFLDEAPEELVKKMEEHGTLSDSTLLSYFLNVFYYYFSCLNL